MKLVPVGVGIHSQAQFLSALQLHALQHQLLQHLFVQDHIAGLGRALVTQLRLHFNQTLAEFAVGDGVAVDQSDDVIHLLGFHRPQGLRL